MKFSVRRQLLPEAALHAEEQKLDFPLISAKRVRSMGLQGLKPKLQCPKNAHMSQLDKVQAET